MNSQGISHCLGSGHPTVVDSSHYCQPVANKKHQITSFMASSLAAQCAVTEHTTDKITDTRPPVSTAAQWRQLVRPPVFTAAQRRQLGLASDTKKPKRETYKHNKSDSDTERDNNP